MEAIILAGGLGTRLRSEVQDIPKSMAPIRNRPFMEYLLDQLISNGITKIVFSVGYKAEHIQKHFKNKYKNCEIVYAVEESLLGTGGAIKNAMKYIVGNDVLVVNGDSFFITDIKAQYSFHEKKNADVTLALKPMENISRYGTVDITNNGEITRFIEKQPIKKGYINTGTYIFNVKSFNTQEFPDVFSIEKDFFEKQVTDLSFVGYINNGYFLDIGIPEAFRKAQYEIGIFSKIDKTWTLFLDRDGVINKKRDNDYVKTLSELELLPDVPKTVANLSQIFGRTIIVTNQQGIGKKLMSANDLEQIHDNIIQKVAEEGGCIDAIYYAPQLVSENSKMRKPEIGMALKAKEDFPEIDFSKSIMIGDSPSDINFGKLAKMIPVMITDNNYNQEYDYNTKSLNSFSNLLNSIIKI